MTGSGLCILSKHPIVDVYFHQWPINGYAHKIHQGDWFGGKGIGLCKIQINGIIVNLYTAHVSDKDRIFVDSVRNRCIFL